MKTGSTCKDRCRPATFLTSISLLAFAGIWAASPASAQAVEEPEPVAGQTSAAQGAAAQASDQSAPETTGEDLVVTGSRIVRDGYKAPTPVAVLSNETLDAIAATNVADAINRLPALASSTTPRSQPAGLSGGALGVNLANLRGLGPSRTLVLLDGRRTVNASVNAQFAAPDINLFPNDLISRVDVVTGGASAVYGSDALAGVINFVIDRDFTGLKGRAQGGVSNYGDNESYLATLSAGTRFADDRGSILVSGEIAYDAGVPGNTRPWNDNNAAIVPNPAYTATNGLPYYTIWRETGLSVATPGGLIVNGPLRGVMFGPGGTPTTFNFGRVASNLITSGGDWRLSRIDRLPDIAASVARKVLYGRLAFDLTDNIKVFGEGHWANARVRSSTTPNWFLGDLSINADNAFIPASVASRLSTLGATSFLLGTTNADIGPIIVRNERSVTRWTVGFEGGFDALDSSWNWNVSYQQSRAVNISSNERNTVISRFLLAADAVRSPSTGAIVCRSTLTSPDNGCVPYNVFGTGVNGQSAIDYVNGSGYRREVLTQDVASANLRGEPFSTWAGPVSIALNAEHRREGVTGVATALDETRQFLAGNYRASRGSYNVTEGSIELVVPLAKDYSWAKALDVSAAARATNYSTSGYVTTWKLGVSYAPVDDIRFRATRSRDIRAPNLGQLFSGGQTSGAVPVFDPFTNTQLRNTFQRASGNPGLKPEIANTVGAGVVFTPSFIPGLQASIDYYDINIAGAVTIPSSQSVVDLCFAGNQTLCQFIERTNGVISLVVTSPQNVQSQSTNGLDMELTYQLPLANISSGLDGTLTFRGYGTYIFALKTSGIGDGVGITGNYYGEDFFPTLVAPRFRSTVSLTYDTAPVTASVFMRYVAPGVYRNDLVVCSSGCPAGTSTIDSNRIGSNTLFDFSLSLRPFSTRPDHELFVSVDNIFNQAPPLLAGDPATSFYLGQGNTFYDRIGRYVRGGVRFKF